MIAVGGLAAEVADAGVAVDAAGAGGVVAQVAVEVGVGDEGAAGGDGVALAGGEGGFHGVAGAEAADADDGNLEAGLEVGGVVEVETLPPGP